MSRNLILIQRTLTKDDIQWIKENYEPVNSVIFNEIQDEFLHLLEDYNQEFYQLEEAKKNEINRSTLDAILDFGDFKSDSKFSFAQRFQYQQLNIWYYNKFRTYFALRESNYQVEKIKQFKDQFDSIVLFSNSNYLGLLSDFPNVMIRQNQMVKPKKKKRLKFLLKFVLRSFLNYFLRHNPINKYLLISPSERVQPMLNRNNLEKDFDDPIFGYLLKKYGRDLIILNEMNVPHPGSDPVSTPWLPKHHRFYFLGEAVLFRALFNLRIWKEWKIVSNKFKRILEKLSDNKMRPEHMAILKLLTGYQSSHNYFIFRYLAYRKFFKKRKIKGVLAADENSMFVKVVLDAAKEANILTIGVQHGNIHSLHPAYRYTEKDIELHPMPDYTLIWGNRWKEVLINMGNYNEEELVVVGQLRTDIIPKLHELDANRSFTVVFASQPQMDEQLRERAAMDVFRMVKEFQLNLKLKLHPRENDKEFYLDIAEKVGLSSLKFTGDEDLYEVILNSDLVITCYSTVGAESAYFHKPLIILDYLKEDINGYAKDGIAFQASNYEELRSICAGVQSKKLEISKSVQDNYIRESAYKIDGNVSKRIMEWLRDLHPITSHSVE